MDPDKAARNLQVIRQLMERPVRYSTQSGLAAIFAGCVVLAGMWLDWHFRLWAGGHVTFWIDLAIWGGVFLVSLAGTLGLTRLREIRQGMPFWSPAKRKLLVTILAPFLAVVGLTTILGVRWFFDLDGPTTPDPSGLIVSCWMLFYGLACWQVSQYSTREIGLLGAAFIAAGLVTAAFFQSHPYSAMGIGFGGFHIVYGIYAWIRYGG
jgi:hypothetical protein